MRNILLAGLFGYLLGRQSCSTTVPEEEPDSGEIEIGASGLELRYCKAKEALRQAERSLTLEATTMASTLSQATTLLGWIITGITASAVVALGPQHPEWKTPATIIAFGLLGPAMLCVFVVYPRRDARIEGFDPPQIISSYFTSELEQLEGMALGLFVNAIISNRRKIFLFKLILSIAWGAFVLVPVGTFCLMDYESIKQVMASAVAAVGL